ncbi:hypothetical protein ACFWU5_15140 [Nocardia sp. NPDC058640]|uniref:hypothetical protein n=1 Tax=Nocardia sp. NPDC058640 TaxID=3346571 RepID=UPI003667F7C2
MKVHALLIAPVAAITLTFAGAAPAQADGFIGTDNFSAEYTATDYPNSCLIVQNHIGSQLTVRLDYPTGYSHWTIEPEAVVWLDGYDGPVTSPSGNWQLHVYPPVLHSWVFDPYRTRGGSCNGSWIYTAN